MVTKKLKLIILSALMGLSGQVQSSWTDWLQWGTQAAAIGTQAAVLTDNDNVAEKCYTVYDFGSKAVKTVYTGQMLTSYVGNLEKAWNLGAMYYGYNPALDDVDPVLHAVSDGLQTSCQIHAIAENTASRDGSVIDFSRVSSLTPEYLAGAGLCYSMGSYLPTWCSVSACSAQCTATVASCTPACASFTLPVTQYITLSSVAYAALLGKFALGAGALYAGHKAAEYVASTKYGQVKSTCKSAYERVKRFVNGNPVAKYGAIGCAVLYKVLANAKAAKLAELNNATTVGEVFESVEASSVPTSVISDVVDTVEKPSVFSHMLNYFIAKQKAA